MVLADSEPILVTLKQTSSSKRWSDAHCASGLTSTSPGQRCMSSSVSNMQDASGRQSVMHLQSESCRDTRKPQAANGLISSNLLQQVRSKYLKPVKAAKAPILTSSNNVCAESDVIDVHEARGPMSWTWKLSLMAK